MTQVQKTPPVDDVALYPDPLQAEDPRDLEDGSVLDLFTQLPEWKSFIFKVTAACAFVGVVVALVWPKSFTATTRIMPPQQGQSSLASAMMGQLGSIASSLGGSSSFGKTTSDVYLYVLDSQTVADDLIDRFSLMSVYKEKWRVYAENDLKSNTRVSSGKEGGISISVSDHDPQRAANIANAYVDELKKMTQTLAVTEAGRRRVFFEHEVQLASDELAKAEMDMKKTQEQTGILMLEPQSRAMIEGLASLQGQIAVQEATVESMRAFATDENPDLKRAETELAAMKTELSRLQSGKVGSSVADMDIRKVPEKGLAYLRAMRELKYREAVYEAMTKQYQIARVDEAKDAALIQVLDKAVTPELKTSPKRALIVIMATFAGLFLAVTIVALIERGRRDRRYAERLESVKSRLIRLRFTRA